jgi:Cysteine rich repeat
LFSRPVGKINFVQFYPRGGTLNPSAAGHANRSMGMVAAGIWREVMQHPAAKPAVNCSLLQLGVRSLLMVLTLALIRPAWAQQPSPEQISAIRSSCRADYQAHCSSVQPGGPEALACLKKNIAALSPGCQKAVGAAGAPGQNSSATSPASGTATPAAAAAAAAPTPPAGAGAPAMGAMPMGRPPRAQLAMLRQACAQDYRVNCAGVPLGGGQVIACLTANQARLSPACQRALITAKSAM